MLTGAKDEKKPATTSNDSNRSYRPEICGVAKVYCIAYILNTLQNVKPMERIAQAQGGHALKASSTSKKLLTATKAHFSIPIQPRNEIFEQATN